jgi:Ca-activated chloride channel family protein
MRATLYSRWDPTDWEDLELTDLMKALSAHLLESGFFDQYRRTIKKRGQVFEGEDPSDELEQLREAIREALRKSGLLSEKHYDQLFNSDGSATSEALEELIDDLLARLVREGYLALQPDGEVDGLWTGDTSALKQYFKDRRSGRGSVTSSPITKVEVSVTQKGSDLLGMFALREVLGGLGSAEAGAHATNRTSTGVELIGSSKQYEYGDTLTLDTTRTLSRALARSGGKLPLMLEAEDIWVQESEYQSSCATVIMLDCSHSMILYGEDRFTPAKQVALALAHLVRTQFPGDSLHAVLFHDGAEEIPLSQLARVQVGPYHTNTAEGLRLARRVLQGQAKQMKQILMITDGKPSAIFVGGAFEVAKDGPRSTYGKRIYKNSAGLDPVIVEATLAEAAMCRRSGIALNTFMLTEDYFLTEFVRQLTEVAQGKAFFTTPTSLGSFLLVDFMKKRSRMVSAS